jgi:hypothetical protein
MSLQVIYENDFRIVRAQGWNNGLPGGKEYWVIYATENFPDKPAVVEKLEDAIEWIRAKAGLTPPYSVSFETTQPK